MVAETVFHVGTSGFSYSEWRPAFYPEGMKTAGMLAFYARQLPSVELNNTFYRMPTEPNVQAWNDQVPPQFRFAIKAPRGITWSNRLVDCEEYLQSLFLRLEPLGDKVGCVLYLVPKFVHCDLGVLRGFLEQHPKGTRPAFEFVHESWSVPEVHALLHAHGATVVASDKEDEPAPELAMGAPWYYLRLRRLAYTDDELRAWRDRMQDAAVGDAFVFFKHEDSCAGPALARRFLAL